MCKKRHMRWSRLGAQLLLHVRTALLNGRLETYTGLRVSTARTAESDDTMPMAA
jgi:hypothetical protein